MSTFTPGTDWQTSGGGVTADWLNNTYRELLGRDVGAEGLNYYGTGHTQDQVRNSILLSDEYANKSTAPSDTGVSPNDLMMLAMQYAMGGAEGYEPATFKAPRARAQTVAGRDLSPYMNPYTERVTEVTMNQMDQMRQKAQNANDFAAQQAGAFGGSRHGILGGETNRQYFDQMADTSARLNQANFTNSLGIAQSDVNSLNNMAQFNAANMAAARAANAGAANTANAQKMQGMFNAAGVMSNLAGNKFNMQNTVNSNLLNQGAMQQGQTQQILDNIKNQYLNWGNWGAQNPMLDVTGTIGGQSTSSNTGASGGLLGALGSLAAL